MRGIILQPPTTWMEKSSGLGFPRTRPSRLDRTKGLLMPMLNSDCSHSSASDNRIALSFGGQAYRQPPRTASLRPLRAPPYRQKKNRC
jgi:hypothetical protein